MKEFRMWWQNTGTGSCKPCGLRTKLNDGGNRMKNWSRKQKNILFLELVLWVFLSMPLYMNYLPASERLGIYFLEKDGIRGPFLWLPVLLYRAGLGIQLCCKIFIFCVNLGCLVTSLFCFTKIAGNCYAGFAGSFCYCFSVYYIYIYMVRGSLGEMTAFIFLPLYGLGLWQLYTEASEKKNYWKSGIPLAGGLLGIWLSCIPLAFIFSGFTLLIALILAPRTFRRKTFAVLALSCGAVMILTLGLTIPYTEKMLSGHFYADIATGNSFATRALLPSQLLLPFHGNSNYHNEPQDHSGHIGLGLPFLIFFILWAAEAILRKKGERNSLWRQTFFLTGLCVFSAFLCTTASPWRILAQSHPLLRVLLEHIGYPWRFLAPAVLSGSMAVGLYGGRIWKKGKKAMGLFLLGVTVCNVLSGVYLMNSLLYTTEPNPFYETDARYQDTDYIFYISE